MESIQYNACLAITGAIRGTLREKIYQEHPKYLFHLIPVRCTSYATRTESNIPLIKAKHNFFKNYFFPLAIIEWNNLDPNLRVFQSLRKKYLISYDLLQILF